MVLTLLWLLFGVTSTAHAGMASPLPQPCHEAASSHHKPKTPPAEDLRLMPCCSPQAAVAPADIFVPASTRIEYLHLMPDLQVRLRNLIPAYEPPPPKTM